MPERLVTTGFREPAPLICPRCARIFSPDAGYRTQLEDFSRHVAQHASRSKFEARMREEDERAGFCSVHRSFTCEDSL